MKNVKNKKKNDNTRMKKKREKKKVGSNTVSILSVSVDFENLFGGAVTVGLVCV